MNVDFVEELKSYIGVYDGGDELEEEELTFDEILHIKKAHIAA